MNVNARHTFQRNIYTNITYIYINKSNTACFGLLHKIQIKYIVVCACNGTKCKQVKGVWIALCCCLHPGGHPRSCSRPAKQGAGGAADVMVTLNDTSCVSKAINLTERCHCIFWDFDNAMFREQLIYKH